MINSKGVSMRRRLTLFVGWLIAVVGSGLVASGAAAIAGGQVTDRPLQPLSAAEVAALPVAPVFAQLAIASGGSQETLDERNGDTFATGNESSDEERAAAADTRGFVVRPDREPIATPLNPPLVAVPLDPIGLAGVDTEPSDGSIFHLAGGAFAVGGTKDSVVLLWATPRTGFATAVEYLGPTELIVSFTGTEVNSSVRVSWSEEGLVGTSVEGEAR